MSDPEPPRRPPLRQSWLFLSTTLGNAARARDDTLTDRGAA